METLRCIETRLATREFSSKRVPEEVVRKILEAGRLSPSSKNSQPWHFVVVTERDTLEALSQLSPTARHIADAPMAISVFTIGAKLHEIDGTRALQDMILAAWDLGVGSCWTANFREEEVKELLDAPNRARLLTVVPFGYPEELTLEGEKRRKPLTEIAHRERFGYEFTASEH